MTSATATAKAGAGRRGRLRLPAPEQLLLVLLVFVPLAALAEWLHWGAVQVFVFAAIAIIPLAGLMGSATESLAHRFGAGIGGLLNATFGNAAELIIALVALQRGLLALRPHSQQPNHAPSGQRGMMYAILSCTVLGDIAYA